MNHRTNNANYLFKKSFRSTVTAQTHRHTHASDATHCSTRTTKVAVVGDNTGNVSEVCHCAAKVNKGRRHSKQASRRQSDRRRGASLIDLSRQTDRARSTVHGQQLIECRLDQPRPRYTQLILVTIYSLHSTPQAPACLLPACCEH